MTPKCLSSLDMLLLEAQQWHKPDAATLRDFARRLAYARASIADELRVEIARAEAAERERDELRVALVGGCEDRDTDEGEYYEHGMVG